MQITDEMVMAHAVEDAKFAGKPFDTLGRADRARYLQRSRLCLQAAAALVDVPAEPVAWALKFNGSIIATTFKPDEAAYMKSANANCDLIPLYPSPSLYRQGEDSAEVIEELLRHLDKVQSNAIRAGEFAWHPTSPIAESIEKVRLLAATRSASPTEASGGDHG